MPSPWSPSWSWHPLLRVDLPALATALSPLLRDTKAAGRTQLSALLHTRLAAQLAAASARAQLLECELRFCCRAAALQAHHVSHLFMLVCGEIEAAGKERGRVVAAANSVAGMVGDVGGSGSGLVVTGVSAAQATAAAAALAAVMQGLQELGRCPSEQGLADLVSSLHSARPRLELGLRALVSAGSSVGVGAGAGGVEDVTEKCVVDVVSGLGWRAETCCSDA